MPESSVNSSTQDTNKLGDSSADQLVVETIDTPMGDSDGVQTAPKPQDTGYIPLQDFIGIDNPDDAQKEKLEFIWSHFSKGRDRADTMEAVKEAKGHLSQPEIGETHLHKFYSYVKLLEDARSIEREKKVYEV